MHRVNSMVPPALLGATAATRFVLVADNDERSRRLMVRALRTVYTVYEVIDGEQAWRVLQGASTLDCAVLSMQLAVTSGLELARQIRSDPRLRNLALVFLTSAPSAAQVAEGIGLGVRQVLRKPVKVKALVDAVASAIGER